jgi:hypothetical protein
MSLTRGLTIFAKIRYSVLEEFGGRRKKTEDGQNWREWLESRPLVVLVGAAIAVSSTTLGVAKYFFDQEKNISEKSHATELQQVKTDDATEIRDLKGRLLSIERHVGTETIWDVSTVLISQRQAKALGSDFTYLDDLDCYLAVPKSEAWTFKQMNELEFVGMIWGPKWLQGQLETPLGKVMSGFKISCWRGPDVFEIETGNPELPVLHAFPYVAIERVNNQKLREVTGNFIDEQELEAKRKEVEKTKGTLGEDRSKMTTGGTPATSPSATESGSPGAAAEKPGSVPPSDAEAKEAVLDLFLDSDIVAYLLNYNLSGVIVTAGIVKGAAFGVFDVQKKGNVFYMHSRIVAPPSGTRPKVYLEKESTCIGDKEDTVIIQTCAPSTDPQRPPDASWIASWIAGLRVVSR